MNEIQKSNFILIREAICNSISFSSVRYGAIKVVTPFFDWLGESVSIYITEDGNVTDGERTLNQIKALRAYDEFVEWPDRVDYFADYNINPIGNSLDIQYLDSPEDILRYIQGVSRLPMLFEANPKSDKEDRFPTIVRNATMEYLMNEYPNRPSVDAFQWANKLCRPYLIPTKTGIKIHSDMHPVNKNKNVQIIGMANATKSAKDAHVASKLYNSLYWKKTNRMATTIVVVSDISIYSEDSQSAMQEEANPLIQIKDGKIAQKMLAIEVAEA